MNFTMNVHDFIKNLFDDHDLLPLGYRNITNSLSTLFHENSKFSRYTLYSDVERIMTFTDPFILRKSANPFKTYVTKDIFHLNKEVELESNNFLGVLQNRRSRREFESNYKLNLNELSALCYLSYGVTHWEPIKGDQKGGAFGYRIVPSGGALYPMELYFVSFNTYLPKGLYHYRPDTNYLELIKEGDFQDEMNSMILAAPKVDLLSASGLFFTTNIIERVIIKYGDRGYRFMTMEAGAVNMMLSLIASSLDLSACSIGGYYDDELNDFLEIDGGFETINNVLIIGKGKS